MMILQSKQKKPLISVCIPVFNGEKYIRECVESVLAQSERDFELIISDNCSTDRTLEICAEFTDSRIRIFKNEQNVGSIENFNKCIQSANGELFLLLPCDDLLEENCLEQLSGGFITNPSVGIAFASHVQIDHRGNRIVTCATGLQDGVLSSKEAVKMIAENFNPIQQPMVRLKVFSEVGKFDPSFGCFCDIQLWSKVLFYGWDAYFVNKPLTALRCYEGQGQSLFRQNTKNNLKKLSDHYGRSLNSAFYRKNHFNRLFFEFVQFFNYNVNAKLIGYNGKLEKLMISRVVRSHIGNLYFSIRHVNFSSFMVEATIFAKFVKVYGLIRTLGLYFSVVISSFKRIKSLDSKHDKLYKAGL